MARNKQTKGKAPSTLTGQLPVSGESPWWRSVASELTSTQVLVGHTFSIERLTELISAYPDGRRPRTRTVARRLLELNAIELVERGPNGSKGKGAKYKILPESSLAPAGDPLIDNEDFLEKAVERMTREKRKR